MATQQNAASPSISQPIKYTNHVDSSATAPNQNNKSTTHSGRDSNTEFSTVMNTLLTNLSFLKDRVEHTSQTTASILDKASLLRGQIKRKYIIEDYGSFADKPRASTLPSRHFDLASSVVLDESAKDSDKKKDERRGSTVTGSSGDTAEVARLKEREQELSKIVHRLDVENQTLADMVEEYQSSIDLIMNKYRLETQNVTLHKDNYKHFETMYKREKEENDVLRNENVLLKQKIEQMINVMHMAVQQDNEISKDEEAVNEQLALENETLRQLLQISDVSTLAV
jgi:hypothetical protein